jgi:hypothetical protein
VIGFIIVKLVDPAAVIIPSWMLNCAGEIPVIVTVSPGTKLLLAVYVTAEPDLDAPVIVAVPETYVTYPREVIGTLNISKSRFSFSLCEDISADVGLYESAYGVGPQPTAI